MSKFADNLEDLAENTAEYIRRLEEENLRLREEKNYFLHKAGENIAEIAELQAENNNLRETLRDYEECSKSLTLEKHELLQTLQLMIDTHDSGGWPTATITIARAAIAKVKGE